MRRDVTAGLGLLVLIAVLACRAPAETPAAVIQSATTGDHRQMVGTVSTIALESERAGFAAPSIVVIGAVAGLAEKLGGWLSAARSGAPAALETVSA